MWVGVEMAWEERDKWKGEERSQHYRLEVKSNTGYYITWGKSLILRISFFLNLTPLILASFLCQYLCWGWAYQEGMHSHLEDYSYKSDPNSLPLVISSPFVFWNNLISISGWCPNWANGKFNLSPSWSSCYSPHEVVSEFYSHSVKVFGRWAWEGGLILHH